MSSKLGKSIMSKQDSVNTVSSTSELTPPSPLLKDIIQELPPLSRLIKLFPSCTTSVPVVPNEWVRKRKRPIDPITERYFKKIKTKAASESIGLSLGLSNLEFDQWIDTQVSFLEEVWEENKFEQRGTTSENDLALLVEAIDELEKIKWIVKNLRFMYKEDKKKLKELRIEE